MSFTSLVRAFFWQLSTLCIYLYQGEESLQSKILNNFEKRWKYVLLLHKYSIYIVSNKFQVRNMIFLRLLFEYHSSNNWQWECKMEYKFFTNVQELNCYGWVVAPFTIYLLSEICQLYYLINLMHLLDKFSFIQTPT